MQGERGAQADGRMVWVGKVFNPRTEPSEAFPKPHPGVARYQAGLMDLEELGARMRRQAAQVGMDRAEPWVALTDGGNGLDDFMDVFFPAPCGSWTSTTRPNTSAAWPRHTVATMRMPPRN